MLEKDRCFAVEEYLTFEERVARSKMIEIAQKKIKEGYKVKIRNKRLWIGNEIGGSWWRWNKEEDKLKESVEDNEVQLTGSKFSDEDDSSEKEDSEEEEEDTW